jgi:phenylacetate-coenzyme A ligase PaaK-like adenylate-forming protein
MPYKSNLRRKTLNSNAITPLQDWIINKIGISPIKFTKEALISYQINKIKDVITYAKKNSFFYNSHLNAINSDDINTVEDIKKIPFTSMEDIIKNPFGMVCVKHSMIERIVTLSTSGTTGNKKRIFFTDNDQELTIDFFANGMKTMVERSDKVLILMRGKHPEVSEIIKKRA